MDPITLATMTSALVQIALDVTKGVATDAAKALWAKASAALGLAAKPSDDDVAVQIARKLQANPKAAAKLVAELQALPKQESSARLVGSLTVRADNVVVADTVNVSGDFVMGGRPTK